MAEDKIKIIANTNAVDATIYTKGDAITNYSRVNGVPLEQIAGIGDELLDISFLTTPGLGFVGTVANAQKQVIDVVGHLANGFVSQKECLSGFIEFYELASKRGITHVFGDRAGTLQMVELARQNGITKVVTDKDGVIVTKGDYSRAQEFRELLDKMAHGYPHISVLTGSSLEQNVDFMNAYGLDDTLCDNPSAQQDPYMLLSENGLIQVNVLTKETRNLCAVLNPELHRQLIDDFKPVVIERLERMIQRLGLTFGRDYKDQRGKCYVPDKESMVTINIPREFPDGIKDYRKSVQAEALRNLITNVMDDTAKRLGLPYEVVRG